MHDDDVAAVAGVDQGEDRGIAHIAAVPIVLAIDLDSLKHRREAGGSEHRIGTDFAPLEDPQPVRSDVACADEHLHFVESPQSSEVDLLVQYLAQRMIVARIGLVRREHARIEIQEHPAGGKVEIARPPEAIDPRRLHDRVCALGGHSLPEFSQAPSGAFAARLHEAIGDNGRVHGPRAGADDALDGDARILEQPVENSPGESAV